MLVTATDIDLKCVHMCYLQLSLLGIPAVVIHGNSLTLEEHSHWFTPAYILDGWAWKNLEPSEMSEVVEPEAVELEAIEPEVVECDEVIEPVEETVSVVRPRASAGLYNRW